jgi:hypothetical protein
MYEVAQLNGTKPNTVRIIACRVFKPALDNLRLEREDSDIRLTYLPPNLHLRPQELGKYLRREITVAKRRKEHIVCLYGECFPNISEYCLRHGVSKVPGPFCWEMLLGSERYNHLLEEDAGTYFVEKELIFNFKEYCIEPLELYDEEMRQMCFKHYHRILYVRQPSDPDLSIEVNEIAEFLGLSLEIQDADYTHLQERLSILI